ncbi:YkgJ family cysteine cluster protein, partial [Pseudomonas aeruginosa]|nr:YkgJ family cysteine cluster protein [Pseudomonas aeruginosa]
MAGGPTALTLIARTSATGAQPLSLRARFPPPPPPLDNEPPPAPRPPPPV